MCAWHPGHTHTHHKGQVDAERTRHNVQLKKAENMQASVIYMMHANKRP